MYDAICHDVCTTAVRLGRVSSRGQLPVPTPCYAPVTGGKPAGDPTLLNKVFLGTEEQFHRHGKTILQEVFTKILSFDEPDGWMLSSQRSLVLIAFLQFFRRNENYPALIWITPTWFLMTTELPPHMEVKNETRLVLEIEDRDTLTKRCLVNLDLGFAQQSERKPLMLPTDRDLFYYPHDRDDNPSVVRLVRKRQLLVGGRAKGFAYEDCLSLGRPGMKEDDRWLDAAKVPVHSHEGFYVRKKGQTPYLDTCVVTCATLSPDDSTCQNDDVDYFTIFLHRKSAIPLEFSTSTRRFDSFVQHHPGLNMALRSATRR